MKLKCLKCGNIATWFYMPGEEDMCYCDKHVPRGCSCNDDPNEPCCEFWYNKDGFERLDEVEELGGA